jgi:hypothetical protein
MHNYEIRSHYDQLGGRYEGGYTVFISGHATMKAALRALGAAHKRYAAQHCFIVRVADGASWSPSDDKWVAA